MFEISTPKKKFNANNLTFNGSYPYVARGESNNGIRGYINEDIRFLNEANTLSFGQDTATIFYQPKPYFTGDKIKIFCLKQHSLNRYSASFFIAVMKREFARFSWGSTSFNVETLANVSMLLPVYSHIDSADAESTLNQCARSASLESVVGGKRGDKGGELAIQAPLSPLETYTQENTHKERALSLNATYAEFSLNQTHATPTKTHKIHFTFMENFIKALEKDRIKQVILYQKAIKKAYEKVVAKK